MVDERMWTAAERHRTQHDLFRGRAPMQVLRVMAVDDEALAHRRIELAFRSMPGFELVARAYSGRQAAEALSAAQPDIVLLDVEMANVGGLEFAAQLTGPAAPVVIFVTAFEAYAVEAFRLRAADYVLKPVQFDRLASALENARKALRLVRADRLAAELRLEVDALRTGDPQMEHVWAQGAKQQLRIPVAQVDWFEAERDYVRVHLGAQSYLMPGPLSELEARLRPGVFRRIRRSALVRIDAIRAVRRITPTDRRVVLGSGQEVRVGKTYMAEVDRLLRRS